jgi:hypothetical protein
VTRGRWLAAALAAALLLLGARAVAGAVVEYRWFAAFGDGAAALWRARAASLAVLRGLAAAAGAAYVYLNLLGVVSSVDTVVLPRRVGGLDIVERVPAARLRWTCAAVGLALGAALALPLDGWADVDALLTRRALGELEPYTGRDLAFFVHWLPVETALYAWALLTLVVTGALVLGLYALTPGLRWAGGRPRLSGRVRRHLTLFGVGVLLLLAWGHRLDAYALLSAGSGDAGAFTGVDQVGAMPARFALGVFTALAALVVLRAGWMGQARVAFWAVTAVVAGTLLVRGLAPAVTARLADPRALADADAAAAANRALYTQRAFGVDRVRPAPAGYGLDAQAIAAGALSAWDAPALVRAVTIARRTRADGDVGFQPAAGGALAAVLLEFAPPNPAGALAPGDTTDERTVVVLDAARADELGRPVALGGAPISDAGRRVRLLVYPGAPGRVLVRGGAGDRGVVGDPLDDWRVRLAHALAGRDLRIAFEASDVPAVRAVDRRDLRARVGALAPFFAQGRAAAPIVAGDSVWFAVPLYSASESYPLAQRYTVGAADWAAFRHAATALVNARSGGVRLVPAPELDADARAWVRRFPRLFTPASSLPGELARALPPPTEGALVQAYAYAQFGARGERPPSLRRVQPPDGGDTALAGPGRAPLVLPAPPTAPADGAAARPTTLTGWTLPLLSTADRVEGVIVAFGGPAARTLWLVAGATSPRWQELLDAIDAAPGPDSGRPAGGGAAGSGADAGGAGRAETRGHLRAVPVGGTLVYARPEYRVGQDGAPSLVRVVALAGDTARAGATPAAALAPDAARVGADTVGAALAGGDPLTRARGLYLESRAALRRGDWAAVGRALEALGAALGAPSGAGQGP